MWFSEAGDRRDFLLNFRCFWRKFGWTVKWCENLGEETGTNFDENLVENIVEKISPNLAKSWVNCKMWQEFWWGKCHQIWQRKLWKFLAETSLEKFCEFFLWNVAIGENKNDFKFAKQFFTSLGDLHKMAEI